MKIAILTGGGDVPGLNTAIKGLTLGALEAGFEVLGIRNGWQGLLHLQAGEAASRAQWILPLDRERVRKIDRDGGTILHSSRVNPGKVKQKDLPSFLQGSSQPIAKGDGLFDCTKHVLANLAELGVDVLIPIGGDDTLSYGHRLHTEGFATVGLPKTMDNDVFGTDYCLGFGTAVRRTVEYIHQLRSAVGSHERFGIVEVMGRNCGATALIPGYLASVDRCLIAEVPFELDVLAEHLLADRAANPSRYAMCIVSEGAQMRGEQIVERGEADPYGHRKLGGIGQITGELLTKKTGVGAMYQNIGYLMRSGRPDPIDVMVTYNFANLALELIRKKTFGRLVCLSSGRYTHKPLDIVAQGIKRVDLDAFYDKETYRPAVKSVLDLPLYLY